MESRFEKTLTLLKLKEEELIIKNLGSSINTESPEYLPVITADGKKMYFTGYDRKGKIGLEDVFVSEMIDGKWSNAEIIGNINTKSNESVDGISADGNRLVFFGNFANSFGKGDIFYSDNMLGGWSMIKHFPQPINSNYYDGDAFLTCDGKAIFFVSDRSGGVGGFHAKDQLYNGNYWGNTDIYVCTKTATGWSSSINIGEMINTPGAERTPFLHSDGKTLYFSSDSHYGLGGIDVYKTVRLNDSLWTEWSEPVNLGKEINTPEDDWGYRISTDGKLAYFAADNRTGGFGDDDIYSVTLPKIAKPEPVVTISGKVTNEKGIPMEAAIKWDNLSTQKNMGELKSNPGNGSYFIVLPSGKKYGYYAEKEGYYSVSKNIDFTLDSTSKNLTGDIILYSIEEIKTTSEPVVINNIFPNFDTFELKPESFPELDRLAEILKGYPDRMVEISGHTDNKGSAEYNNTLSFNRASSVVEYLISKGCKREKLIAKGYGSSIPIADNSSEKGQVQNRRVEFKFLMN
jgi:outer membrane protein OmpA-like peptidoglycan-associated protein